MLLRSKSISFDEERKVDARVSIKLKTRAHNYAMRVILFWITRRTLLCERYVCWRSKNVRARFNEIKNARARLRDRLVGI